MSSKNTAPQPTTARQALKLLEKGNDKYVADDLAHVYEDTKRRAELQKKQQPWAVILTCADSRVVPELIFDRGIGQLFVIRVAGNIANTSTLASIEYAVANLNVKLIVVLGHESCGAVAAAMGDDDYGHNLNQLLAHIKPAIGKTKSNNKDKQLTDAIEKNAVLTAKQLEERSLIIREEKGLRIVPAIYRLKTGKVDYLD